jgi:hypothetical protein
MASSSSSQPSQPSPAAAAALASQPAVFVDAVAGRHAAAPGAATQALLDRRRLTFSGAYGWQYDAVVDDPGAYAVSGAHARFSQQSLLALAPPAARAAERAARQAGQAAGQLLRDAEGALRASAAAAAAAAGGRGGGRGGAQSF